MNRILLLSLLVLAGCTAIPSQLSFSEGEGWNSRKDYADFELSGEARTGEGAEALLRFCQADGNAGYEVLLHNGAIDGSRKTGSLLHVRNLYRSLATDGEWFGFSVAVRGKNIGVKVNGLDVVCYTEPDEPWRSEEHAG